MDGGLAGGSLILIGVGLITYTLRRNRSLPYPWLEEHQGFTFGVSVGAAAIILGIFILIGSLAQ